MQRSGKGEHPKRSLRVVSDLLRSGKLHAAVGEKEDSTRERETERGRGRGERETL